jgi:probable O-glycosylation ligase (exosortase A-associated)
MRETRSGIDIPVALAACGLAGIGWFATSLPIAIPLGLLPFALFFTVRKPFFLVVLFVCFSFFRIHEAYPQLYPLRIPQLLALAVLASLGWKLATRRIETFMTRELKLFLAFSAFVTIGVVFASNIGIARGYWTGTFSKIVIMVLAISWLVTDTRQAKIAARIFVLCGMAVAAVAISNKHAGIGLVEGTRVTIGRAMGSMLGDPNDLALVLTFPISFAMALAIGAAMTRGDRVLGAVALPVLILGVLYTQSRGGLLGMVAVFGVFGWNRVQNKFVLASAGAIAGGLLFILAGVGDRSVVAASESAVDESSMGRLYAWQAAFNMALAHPLTGVGLNNFYPNYFFYSPHWDGKNHAVHSTWFGVVAESGFVGLAIFASLVFVTARLAIRAYAALRDRAGDSEALALAGVIEGLLAGLAGFVASGTFLTMGFVWPFYILFALTVATARCASRILQETPSQSSTAASSVARIT